MTSATILAMMLMLQAPGRSAYSQVVVDEHSGRACSNRYDPMCAAPRFSRHWNGFTRPESWREGLHRYQLIAGTIVAVSEEEHAAGRWNAPASELARYLTSVAFHESRYRRDIHSGKGPVARGDCLFREVNGERKMIPGSCRSVCLGQIMKTRSHYSSPRGYSHESLVGLDPQSTRRCFETMADALVDAAGRCVDGVPSTENYATCIFGNYGGVPNPKNDERILARAKTFRRTRYAKPLEERVLATLKAANDPSIKPAAQTRAPADYAKNAQP